MASKKVQNCRKRKPKVNNLVIPPPPPPPPPPVAERGYWIFDKWLSPMNQAPLSSSLVSGVSLGRYWKNLNPSDGVYDFAGLIADIEACIAAGKKVSIKVASGNKTPDWLFALIPNDTFNELQHIATSTSTTAFRAPVFWDDLYKNKWKEFVSALCSALSPYWGSINYIGASGLSRSSDELRIPSQQIHNAQWDIDSPAQWLALGYDTQKFMDTYYEFTAHILSLIPSHVFLCRAMIPNTTPNILDGRNALTEVVATMGLNKDRYVLLDTYVTQKFDGNAIDIQAKSLGIKVIGQLAEQYFEPAGNGTNYAAALQIFSDWGGYPNMEIYEGNPVDYQTELTDKKPLYT